MTGAPASEEGISRCIECMLKDHHLCMVKRGMRGRDCDAWVSQLNKHGEKAHAWRRIVKTMLAEKAGKQLPKAMGYLGLAWGMVRCCTLIIRDKCRGDIDLVCLSSC